MKMLKRNTSGLEAHAQQKRESALLRTEEAITKLLKENRPVNFNTVSEESGVSRTWLYKEPLIKARIEEIKNQQPSKFHKCQKSQAVSNKSKGSSIDTSEIDELKTTIKKLATENNALRNHLEVVSAMADPKLEKKVEVLERENQSLKKRLNSCEEGINQQSTPEGKDLAKELEQKIKTLEWEKKEYKKKYDEMVEKDMCNQHILATFNELKSESKRQDEIIRDLKSQLESAKSAPIQRPIINTDREEKVIPLEAKKQMDKTRAKSEPIPDTINQQLKNLGITLNKSLKDLINSHPPERVQNALAVVEERISSGAKIKTKHGLFRTAIEQGWEPNQTAVERQLNQVLEKFSDWYDLARAEGIVKASMENPDGDGIVVLEPTGEWTPLNTMFEKGWTLEYLRQIRQR